MRGRRLIEVRLLFKEIIMVHTDLWYASSKEKKVERLIANLTITIPTVLKKQKIK